MRKYFVLALIFLSCTACHALDMNNIPMSQAKANFTKLYKTRWEIFGADGKLQRAIDEAFREQTGRMMFGTKGLQLGMNMNNIVAKIQNSIEFRFAIEYEKFLQELELVWSDQLRNEILNFYQRSSSEIYFTLDNNPMAQAYLRRDYNFVTEDKGEDIMNNIAGELSSKYPDMRITGAKFIGGGMILLARKYLQSYVTKILMRKFTGSAAGKIAGSIVPITGLAMILWSAWDVYSMANEAEDVLREKFYSLNHSMYYEEVPKIYWEGIEPYVRDAFILAYEKLMLDMNMGIAIENTPAMKEFNSGLSKLDQRFMNDRLALLQAVTGYDMNEIIIRLGSYIKSANVQEFDKLAAMLRECGIDNLCSWLRLAGSENVYRFYDYVPLSAWSKFGANNDSVKIFACLADNLTPEQSKRACELSKEKLLLAVNEIPEKFFAELFADDYSSLEIEREISRLSWIEDKDLRRPFYIKKENDN